jgi:hypothetical protein
MVAWCGNCKRPVNQYCDTCGENFGIVKCEKYACGGIMMCPICGAKDLKPMKEAKMGPDPYDYSKISRDDRQSLKKDGEVSPATAEIPQEAPSKCPMCGYDLQSNWKFCPNCGVSFGVKK